MGSARDLVLDAARSLVGSLLLGMPLLYTMETWWLAWRLPAWLILAYAVGGLAVISLVSHHVGARAHHHRSGLVGELQAFAQLFATSFLAAVLVLLLLGIPEVVSPAPDLLRLALLQVVPLGLGATLTELALERAEAEENESSFIREAAVFAAGALFFSLPAAPTEEMQLIAAHAGAKRLALVVVASLALTYLTLYVLEFRGHSGRADGVLVQVGETAAAYVIALLVALGLLAGFGHLLQATFAEAMQETVTLGFVASLGGAAARVVL